MRAKDAYQKKLQDQLGVWDAEIDVWRAKTASARNSTRQEYKVLLKAVLVRRDVVEEKLQELIGASGRGWVSKKPALEAAWHEFKTAYESAAGRFR